MRRSRKRFESVEISFHEMMTMEQLQALKEGRIDVGFGRLKSEDRPLGDLRAVSPVIFSTRHMDRFPELVNMLEAIYEIYDELGIARVKQVLQAGARPQFHLPARPPTL